MTKLEEIRTSKGMTKYRLSQLTGISATSINNIEIGTVKMENVSIKRVMALARALDVEITDLLD